MRTASCCVCASLPVSCPAWRKVKRDGEKLHGITVNVLLEILSSDAVRGPQSLEMLIDAEPRCSMRGRTSTDRALR